MYAVKDVSDIRSYQQVTILERPRPEVPGDCYILEGVRSDGYPPDEIWLARLDVVETLVGTTVED